MHSPFYYYDFFPWISFIRGLFETKFCKSSRLSIDLEIWSLHARRRVFCGTSPVDVPCHKERIIFDAALSNKAQLTWENILGFIVSTLTVCNLSGQLRFSLCLSLFFNYIQTSLVCYYLSLHWIFVYFFYGISSDLLSLFFSTIPLKQVQRLTLTFCLLVESYRVNYSSKCTHCIINYFPLISYFYIAARALFSNDYYKWVIWSSHCLSG